MDDWTTIGITERRLNGLKLWTERENRRTPGNMLDTILERAGVPLLTEQELEKEMAKLGVKKVKA
jgi:hypothetical protein